MPKSVIVILSACLSVASTGLPNLAASEHRREEIEHLVSSMCQITSAKYPTFSPDGKSIAYISNLNGTDQVWRISIDGGCPQLVTVGDTAVQNLKWSPKDNNLLAYGVGQGSLDSQVFVVHPDGTGLRRITPGSKTRNIGPAWTDDGKYLLITSNARGKSHDEPCLIEVATGTIDWLINSDKSMWLLSVSRDGKYGLTSNWTSYVDGVPYVIDLKSKMKMQLMPGSSPSEWFGTISSDSRTIYLFTGADRPRTIFGRVKLGADGKPGKLEVIAQRLDAGPDFNYDFNIPINPAGTQAALTWGLNDKDELSLVDLATGKVEYMALPDGAQRISDVCYSKDGKLLAMALSSPFTTKDIWVMDVQTRKFRQLTFSPHAGVEFSKLVRPEKVSLKSFDGLEMDGYLYRPIAQNSQGLPPYVIDFHGGPNGAAMPSKLFQPLLAQGIGVFAPNVRGSSGHGHAFEEMDDGALRINAIKDIKACFDYLALNRIADPKRIGIEGHSYGGYMAMAGLTEYPELFAAGFEDDGPIDIYRAALQNKAAGYDVAEYGLPIDEKMLKRLSPYYKADRIKAPFMIQQGENDFFIHEAREIAKQLKASGNAPFEYIEFADEGHVLYKMQNRIKSEVARVEFFVKYLKPDFPN